MHLTLLSHYTGVRVNRNHRSNFLVWEFSIRKRQSQAAEEEAFAAGPPVRTDGETRWWWKVAGGPDTLLVKKVKTMAKKKLKAGYLHLR